jgi:very long chain acyl-CoA dehydrogenase
MPVRSRPVEARALPEFYSAYAQFSFHTRTCVNVNRFLVSCAVMSMFVAGTGLAAVGKDLEPVLRASKAPFSNIGTLFSFGVWYARSHLGFHSPAAIPWAPAPLAHVARLLGQSVGAFGDACRLLVIKHGKRLQDQQLLLLRVAEAAIDLTAITASLARAARAVESKSPSADKEVALVELLYLLAYPRLQRNIAAMRGSAFPIAARQQELVADHVLTAGKHVTEHPLGF